MASEQANIRTFVEPPSGPGRLAPVLLQDLYLYDPNQDIPRGRNLLRDGPLEIPRGGTLADQLPPDSCKHVFWLKPKQSSLQDLEQAPDQDTTWIVAAVCSKCRIHLSLTVDLASRWISQSSLGENRSEHQLHHLVRSMRAETLESAAWERQNPGQIVDISVFECSLDCCSTVVSVYLTPAVISEESIDALTDPDRLRARTEAAFNFNANNTQGMKTPSALDVLNDLRIYLKNSWSEGSLRTIKTSNRRFMVRFGPDGRDCREVLETFGFKFVESEQCWQVPSPKLDDSQPLQDHHTIFLDNLEHELLALILSRPQKELQPNPDLPKPASAYNAIKHALGSQKYDKHPFSMSSADMGKDMEEEGYDHTRHMACTALGCPPDASDELVVQAYHSQIRCDPNLLPTYLFCLDHLADVRGSERLRTECELEKSRGRPAYDRQRLLEAYTDIGMDVEAQLDDEHIMGVFSSRLSDMPAHEIGLRESLRIIGHHRGSMNIMAFADNVVNDYGQALAYLGAQPDTADEFLESLVAAKREEPNFDEETTTRALQLIAEERKSGPLKKWLDSTSSTEHVMDTAEAYRALGLDNRSIDDELVLVGYQAAVIENPTNVQYYDRALEAIAQERGSSILQEHLHPSTAQAQERSSQEPVGLDNIGNTCYLNSLLQYFFTMRELREIVLNFDHYKMIVSDANLAKKTVGQRKVTKKEVETAQKFVMSLAGLFRGMIETPQYTIRPEKELARLTLETDGARKRRRSTLIGAKPSLGEASSLTIIEPVLPEGPSNTDYTGMVLLSPVETIAPKISFGTEGAKEGQDDDTVVVTKQEPNANDNSSEATLVSRPGSIDTPIDEMPTFENQQAVLDDKENLSPTKQSLPSIDTDYDNVEPLAPASPSKVNAQAGLLEKKSTEDVETAPMQYAPPPGAPPATYAPPPGKPPPVPPRKPAEPITNILEEYARQQDVTEVNAHCLFQFSNAIRALGADGTGEQIDEIHNTFFGQNQSHAVPETEKLPPVLFSGAIARVAEKPANVYAALDTDYDLSDQGNGTQAYVSMTRPPPVLSIHLDRVSWDRETMRPGKLNDHVDVPETIFLDRYMESEPDSDLMQRRTQTWKLKSQLAELLKRLKIIQTPSTTAPDLPTLFEQAADLLEHLENAFPGSTDSDVERSDPAVSSLGIPGSTIDFFSSRASNLRKDVKDLNEKITNLQQQIKEAFADMRNHPYRLHGAFFHRGGPTGGHYWVYIYDHVNEVWRKYNDDYVTKVTNLNEIFGEPQQSGNTYNVPANPYFLVYIQQDKIDQVVETVKRDIVYAEPGGPPPALPPRGQRLGKMMNQMSEMPPSEINRDSEGDVEMVEYANGEPNNPLEHQVSNSRSYVNPDSAIEKFGDWDDSELMVGGHKPKW